MENSWPCLSVIRDTDACKLCPKCGSSLRLHWRFWQKNKGCIQPLCENYWEKNDK